MHAREDEREFEGDPTERFSDSVRILHREVVDTAPDDGVQVSTPLTRRADLHELRLISRQAARRRLTVVAVLVGALVTVGILAGAGLASWWGVLVPALLLGAFVAVARFSVVDAAEPRRAIRGRSEGRVRGERGHDRRRPNSDREATENIEISIDLSMPTTLGALWDPIPVAPPTYVQQPLLPRTVRTIDLSAPVAPASPLVPTADNPSARWSRRARRPHGAPRPEQWGEPAAGLADWPASARC